MLILLPFTIFVYQLQTSDKGVTVLGAGIGGVATFESDPSVPFTLYRDDCTDPLVTSITTLSSDIMVSVTFDTCVSSS